MDPFPISPWFFSTPSHLSFFDEVELRKPCSTTSTVAVHEARPRQKILREATREKIHGLLAMGAMSQGSAAGGISEPVSDVVFMKKVTIQ